jgi:hypothetical protein
MHASVKAPRRPRWVIEAAKGSAQPSEDAVEIDRSGTIRAVLLDLESSCRAAFIGGYLK